MRVDLTIIIPAYCEERRIGPTLDALADYLKTGAFWTKKSVEVLVVAADAPDKTQAIAQSKLHLFEDTQLLLPGPKVGKGRDVQYGMLRAKGENVMFMDADLATPLSYLESFYKLCAVGNDVVIGVRDLLRYRNNVFRGLFSKFGNFIYRLLTGSKIQDTQCGFKMFRQSAIKPCFENLQIQDWNFDLEVLARAERNHLRVKSVHIKNWQDMPYSTFDESILSITYRMVRDMIKLSRQPR